MSNTKNTTQKIEDLKEKIQQLENQKKQLLQKQKADERKARTHRLVKRGAILESLIPSADTFTNDQIKVFLEKTVTTDYHLSIKIISRGKGKSAVAAAAYRSGEKL